MDYYDYKDTCFNKIQQPDARKDTGKDKYTPVCSIIIHSVRKVRDSDERLQCNIEGLSTRTRKQSLSNSSLSDSYGQQPI